MIKANDKNEQEAGLIGKSIKLLLVIGVAIAGYTVYESREVMFDHILNNMDDTSFLYRLVQDFEHNADAVIETTEVTAENIAEQGLVDGIRTTIASQHTQELVKLIEALMITNGDPYLETPDGQTPLQIALNANMPQEVIALFASYSSETGEATDEKAQEETQQ